MMQRGWTARGLATAVLLAGCSSSSSGGSVTTSNNGCALPPTGVFLAHFVEGSGNTCGPIADSLVSGSDVASASACPGGTGTITDTVVDGGGCSVVVDAHGCKESSGTADLIEKVTWASDYASASGITSITIESGSQQCSGTYTITLTKQ